MRFAMRDWGMREAVSGVRFEVSDFAFAQRREGRALSFRTKREIFLRSLLIAWMTGALPCHFACLASWRDKKSLRMTRAKAKYAKEEGERGILKKVSTPDFGRRRDRINMNFKLS